ncbi:MAG: hypothetical protein ACOX58_07430 [Christensenellales bacterium]|jgi:hypothetical protein
MFKKIKDWFHHHRKEVLIAATILAVTGTVVILLIDGKKIKMPVKELAEKLVPEVPKNMKPIETAVNMIKKTTPEIVKADVIVTVEVDGVMKTFRRAEFIRQLPEGWHASPKKLAQAAEMGIDLKPGETIVNACTVTMRAT